MAKRSNYQKSSPQTQQEALKVAKATQRPGQTKEQTKLIAQGIEKGISLYKKQQKEKSRELNRKMHKLNKSLDQQGDLAATQQTDIPVVYKQSPMAWGLLLLSWLIFIVFIFMFR